MMRFEGWSEYAIHAIVREMEDQAEQYERGFDDDGNEITEPPSHTMCIGPGYVSLESDGDGNWWIAAGNQGFTIDEDDRWTLGCGLVNCEPEFFNKVVTPDAIAAALDVPTRDIDVSHEQREGLWGCDYYVTHKPSGAQWSVADYVSNGEYGVTLERISEGDEEGELFADSYDIPYDPDFRNEYSMTPY